MANIYPPSPALSACDSLADIEDLDAFLDAQGKLSQWPTPPEPDKEAEKVPAQRPFNSSQLSNSEDSMEADGELWRLASALTLIASGRQDVSCSDLDHVILVLLRVTVRPEALAVAYNILQAVTPCADDEPDKNSYRVPDLAVLASISLAMTFMEDKAPDSEYWSRQVFRGYWTAQDIDTAVLEMLAHKSLRMLSLSSESAINHALVELRDITLGAAAVYGGDDAGTLGEEDAMPCSPEAPEPLKLAISNTVQWVHGAVTPAQTPVVETNSFLRLL